MWLERAFVLALTSFNLMPSLIVISDLASIPLHSSVPALMYLVGFQGPDDGSLVALVGVRVAPWAPSLRAGAVK